MVPAEEERLPNLPTQEQIAWAIHSVVGGTVCHVGIPSSYDPWEVEDLRGRKWKVVNDASLTNVPSHLRAELVSPGLTYDDLEQLQGVVRAIRKGGGKINSQCGIHIHIDAEPFDGRKLGNLAKIVYKQEPLILHALGISRDRLNRYTRPVSDEMIQRIEQHRPALRTSSTASGTATTTASPSTTTTAATTGSTCTTSGTRARWSSAGSRRPFTRGGSRPTCSSASRLQPRRSTAGQPPAASWISIHKAPSTTSGSSCSTTLDGEPIPGSGETIQANDCLEVVELMRGQTPFTASRAPRDYMTEVLSGIEGGPTQPLPEDTAAAAAEFLTRLARHGLIEFLPDDKASDPWPERFLEALETVRLSGRTNMLDHPKVTRLTAEMGYPEVAEWLADHRREYPAFVLEGTRPLGKNFGGKENPAPCADK